MQQSRRRSRTPWERSSPQPRHPTGRTRRRWPRAYDGGEPALPAVNRRYRRSFDGDQRVEERRKRRRAPMLDSLRQSPVRNGLIGLAVAGAAAPIAVNRYQTALRTDPSHERVMTSALSRGASESHVAQVWQNLETERASTVDAREEAIAGYLEEYSEFGLTRELAEEIYDLAQEAEIDPDMAYGLVRAESGFKNSATSHVGAVGLTQLMPSTARWLEPGTTRDDLRNPETNLRIGFGYLRQLIDKYKGDVNLALTAYNRGPGTVDRVLDRGGDPDNGYADFVFGKKNHGHKG